MPQVSRPLIALLIATVVFFAVWMVALKPKTTGGSSGGSAPLQSAIDKAHQAVTQSDAASVAHGGTVVSTPAATSSAATPSASATSHPASTATIAAHPSTVAGTAPMTQSATAAKQAAATKHATTTKTTTVIVKPAHPSPVRTAAQRQAVVLRALHQHKVIALLFYNFRAADDRAVKKELAAVSTHGGKVVKLAVPLAELAQYGVVTRQVPVTASPTLILIDAQHKAWTVVGFASEFEISQRVDDALRVKAP